MTEPIARASTARGEVVLRRRTTPDGGEILELRVNGVFVMDTAETASERALASAALARTPSPRRVLIGGLGLGFTLEPVLADPRVEQVTVVELEEPVVAWMRDGTVPHGPALLADPRVRIVVADVAEVVAAAGTDSADLVLLDVDNGPGYLVHQHNAGLYRTPLLEQARRASAAAVVIWSAAEAAELGAAMAAVFADVEVADVPVRLHERSERYWLYTGRT